MRRCWNLAFAFEAFSGTVWAPLLLVTAFAALIAAAARTMLRSAPIPACCPTGDRQD
jgi:hypothetical protein